MKCSAACSINGSEGGNLCQSHLDDLCSSWWRNTNCVHSNWFQTATTNFPSKYYRHIPTARSSRFRPQKRFFIVKVSSITPSKFLWTSAWKVLKLGMITPWSGECSNSLLQTANYSHCDPRGFNQFIKLICVVQTPDNCWNSSSS